MSAHLYAAALVPLQQASLKTLKNHRFICMGTGIEWEELDYHLSIESMFYVTDEKMA